MCRLECQPEQGAKNVRHPSGEHGRGARLQSRGAGGLRTTCVRTLHPTRAAALGTRKSGALPNGTQAHLGGGRTHHFLLGRLSLDVDSSLEIGTIVNGDALGRDVAIDNS